MPPYHILTIDGGGIRGLLTTIVLERLEAAVPGFLEKIDLFLALGITPTAARGLYEDKGPEVFADTMFDNVRDLGNAIGAQYGNVNLKRVLTEYFGNKTLGDLPHKVLISSFDLDNGPDNPAQLRTWKPKFFHNFPGPDSDGKELVVDVAMRTAAAPSFFPVYQGYADGGVFANNPSMAAGANHRPAEPGRR
jgi:patatin-like phospholipase/acyl hydrolase